MKIDLFFCTSPQSDARFDLAEEMVSKWRTVQGIRFIPLWPEVGECFFFQSKRRILAEAMSQSPIYILADDDMEPLFHLNEAISIMHNHPEFGILSAWPSNANIGRWTPDEYTPYEDSDVQEFHDVGGLRFIRKGAIKSWPRQLRKGYDREHCEAMRSSGYRVGYFKNLKAIHHGEGHSDLYPLPTESLIVN